MNFGIPKEVRPLEFRVGLTPAAADSLVRAGHKVLVEHDAGIHAGFVDEDYRQAGAQVVYAAKEAYGRADVVVKVGRPAEEEYKLFQPYQTIMSFLHLAVASPDLVTVLEKERITAIGYETILKDDGTLPLLSPTSEIAGRMSPIIAGDLMGSFKGGRGILLSGIPGIPPAAVVVIGAGVLGFNATRAFHNFGAEVTVLDHDLEALQKIDLFFDGKISTLYATPHNIVKAIKFADVLIASAAVPGGKAPILISREMLKSMRKRAIVLDLAINSGGNLETSRPTNLANPSFVEEDIIHYCVPNVPSRVARTGSYAISNSILPYLLRCAELGIKSAIEEIIELRRGVNTIEGKLVHHGVAKAIGQIAED